MNWLSTIILFVSLVVPFSARAGNAPPGMVLVPAGEALLGSDSGDDDERPARRIFIDAFYIDKYEVTVAQYRRFLQATGHRKPYGWGAEHFSADDQPVVGVSWYDAAAYCKWAGKRLPTEAEWEKAARGSEGFVYPWGNKWQEGMCVGDTPGLSHPERVGSLPQGASPFGVMDMAGNVWEWCADWYDPGYYAVRPLRDPEGPARGDAKVIRGGSWIDSARQLRSSNRYYSHPDVRYNGIGFRCAKDVD